MSMYSRANRSVSWSGAGYPGRFIVPVNGAPAGAAH